MSLAFLIACTGTAPDDNGGDPKPDAGTSPPAAKCTPENIQTELFAKKCGGSCHGAGTSSAKKLDLVAPGLEQRIVEMTSSCNSLAVADKSSPESSFLLQKVSGKPACGDQMPRGKPPLSADEVNCISTWIENLPAKTGTAPPPPPPPPGGGGGW